MLRVYYLLSRAEEPSAAREWAALVQALVVALLARGGRVVIRLIHSRTSAQESDDQQRCEQFHCKPHGSTPLLVMKYGAGRYPATASLGGNIVLVSQLRLFFVSEAMTPGGALRLPCRRATSLEVTGGCRTEGIYRNALR